MAIRQGLFLCLFRRLALQFDSIHILCVVMVIVYVFHYSIAHSLHFIGAGDGAVAVSAVVFVECVRLI